MQKISLFHLFIFEIKSTLESRDQTGHMHFWPCPPNKFLTSFNFCESVSTCKKSVHSIWSFYRYNQFYNPVMGLATPILTTSTFNIFSQLLICMNLYQYTKNKLFPSIHSWDTVNFRVPWQDWPHWLLAMPTQKNFDQLLIYVNLYKHAKKLGWLICSGGMID